MTLTFHPIQGKPTVPGFSRKVAAATVHFDVSDGLLDGHTLEGFTLWQNLDGTLGVTYPARAWTTADGQRKTYQLLRADESSRARFCTAILDAWSTQAPETL